MTLTLRATYYWPWAVSLLRKPISEAFQGGKQIAASRYEFDMSKWLMDNNLDGYSIYLELLNNGKAIHVPDWVGAQLVRLSDADAAEAKRP